jgi:hypothetical protein
LRYHGCAGHGDRAAAISRHALAAVAAQLPPSTNGRRERVSITVRVPHDISDAALSDRIAAALTTRLAVRGKGL